ncbi:DUF4474 domain-containing protein [Sedimentibacter sp. MB31-C6]|uniref:DUF4474 domain-containing protein n=1 Tax=Sedimentibacter sp. MB31-C6 TaxID=3109366 RepID=UPI002DDDBCF4|nr:DUF4474 domain-containing protein [Sedimentibacter sp. MB36-C1]WSI03269.1 DUF4474 domain-containing protein [Sedimentibacter sp. MB36-C1]
MFSYIKNMFTVYEEGNFIPITIVILCIIGVFLYKSSFFLKIVDWMKKSSKKSINSNYYDVIDYDSLNELTETAGYCYDINQDIFYSHINAWQREMGYCRLYDEATAPLNMIIDCEPIYFEYDNKRWLIEFWKGQYGMTTGCEIGVYSTTGPDLDTIFFNGTFYDSVSDDDLLRMACILRKNGKRMFKRKDTHWWLTGFKLGEFSQPWELTMDLKITLKNKIMRNEFIKGLKNAGYLDEEIFVMGNSVKLRFDKPRTKQPYSRNAFIEHVAQKQNKELCEEYQYITYGYNNVLDKIYAIQRYDPNMLVKLLMIGKSESIFEDYWKIKKYL